jgi:hypothetical protein
MQDQSIHQTREALNKRIDRFHNLIGRAVERGDDSAVAWYKSDLREVRAELEQLDEQPTIDTDDAVSKVAEVCKTEMRRYWRNEETLRDNGESINDLNARTAGMLMGFVGVFDALGCEFDFKIDWFDSECRIHQVTARRKDSNAVVFSMQNFGKDEWWA